VTPAHPFVSRPLLGSLAAWSVLCALLLQVRFPHFLFICRQVEAFYNGMADDTLVYHVMQGLVAMLWVLGIVVLIAGAQVVRGGRMHR
jgi:hypothetical protein